MLNPQGMRRGILFSALSATVAFCALFALGSCTNKNKVPDVANPKTITIGALADAKRILPPLASDSASGDISGQIYSGLVKYDKNIMLAPELAESWDILSDGLEVVFHLRHGVKWHDGVEFTADDVVFSYKTITNPEVPTPYSEIYGPVKSVEAVDKYTVKVTYTKPFAPALESWGMGIIPKHILEGQDITKEEFSRNPIGTGPYKMKEWKTGQQIVLTANPDYFEGKPGVDKYISRVIPDTATMFLEIKSGGLDFMGLTPTQYKLQANTGFFEKHFNKFRYPSFGFTYLGYNHNDPRFADKRVRRAFTHAINKDEIIKGVLLGYGTACTGPFPPASWAYNKDAKDPEHNPEKARQLLKEAGWTPGPDGLLQKDGKPFKFTVITNQGNDMRLKTAQIIKEHLKAIGVEMEIKVLEWQAMLHEFVDKRRFEAIILGWALSRDPDLYDIWHSSKTGVQEFNFISYKNEEVDKLLEEGRSTFDMKERKRIYNRIHELIAEDQPYTFLYVPDALPILHKRFKGVEQAPLGIWYNFVHWTVSDNPAEWYK